MPAWGDAVRGRLRLYPAYFFGNHEYTTGTRLDSGMDTEILKIPAASYYLSDGIISPGTGE